jgi:hypothetical protein
MSYGIRIQTQNGLTDISSLITAQFVESRNVTQESGTTPTPSGVIPSNGGVLLEVLDGRDPPQCFIRTDGNTAWTAYAPTGQRSTNFNIIWLRFA